MDRRIPSDDEINERNLEVQRDDTEEIRQKQAGRKQKPRSPEVIAADYFPIVLNHYFPEFDTWLSELSDPRDEEHFYSLKHLIYLGMLMFLSHASSRRQFNFDRQNDTFTQNFNRLINEDNETTATMDAVFYLLQEMDSKGLEEMPYKMVKKLLINKVLEKYRLDDEYLIAIDGTQIFSSKKRHCDKCLTREHGNGTIDYFHTVLEAKLITKEGLAFSVASVFVENESSNYDKQDCELKAFYRLEKKLKKAFPRLRCCLLMDSLYANEKVLEICEKNKWGFFIGFKEGSIPTLYKETFKNFDSNKENLLTNCNEKGEKEEHHWAYNLRYKDSLIHAINVDVYDKNTEEKSKRFVYLTDTRPTTENIIKLNNNGGRQRSKIEEAFNVQKNNGYFLEHNYGAQGFAYKNCYMLIQIVHLFHQLMFNSDLNGKLVAEKLKESNSNATVKQAIIELFKYTKKTFHSLKNFAREIGNTMRYKYISKFALCKKFASSIQIRLIFDSS